MEGKYWQQQAKKAEFEMKNEPIESPRKIYVYPCRYGWSGILLVEIEADTEIEMKSDHINGTSSVEMERKIRVLLHLIIVPD